MSFDFEHRTSDSPFVSWVWRTHSDQAGTFISQAATQWEMVVSNYQGSTRVTIRGPETQAATADSPADAEFFGIVFNPGVFMPHLPTRQLANCALMLPDAAFQSFWLNGAVWQLPRFDNADTFVKRMMREGLLVRDTAVAAAIEGTPPDLSPRSLQYRFLNATGMTQATYRQIARARRAAALLAQGTPILDTVHETGYFDQAHMTRSLKRFIGQTPAQIASSIQGT